MINETIRKVNSFSRKVGIPGMPLVTKRSMRIGSVANKAAGTALIAFGAISKNKWAIPLGIASIVVNSVINDSFEE